MTQGPTHLPPDAASVGPATGLPQPTSVAPPGFLPVAPVRPSTTAGGSAGADEPVIRRAWSKQTYRVSETERTMHVEEHPPVWGSAGDPATWQRTDERPRAVLFESMGTATKLPPLIDRLRGLRADAPRDVALSVVLNGAWVPPVQHDTDGKATKDKTPKPKEAPTQPTDPEGLKSFLTNRRKALVNAWDGPPLEITTAAWERRSRADADGALETVQSSVPYTSLRALAASNDGALEIGKALEQNHKTLWHKMGDDDMPVFNPNPARQIPDGKSAKDVDEERLLEFYGGDFKPGDELTALEKIEKTEGDHATTVVTFGYNLTSEFLPKTQTPVSPGITAALQALYRIEMELRDQIHALKAPIYPSEPTSFYRTVKGNTAADVWRQVPDAKTGGSGQQLEGAKLVLALSNADESKNVTGSRGKMEKEMPDQKTKPRNESPPKRTEKSVKSNSTKSSAPVSTFTKPEPKVASGITQFAFHTVQVNTSAGGRNDGLVAVLNGWLAGQDASKVIEQAVEAEINKLDQCALKEREYLDKVFGKLPKPVKLADGTTDFIAKLVAAERARAAKAVCDVIKAEIAHPTPQPVHQGGPGQAQQGGPQAQQPAPVQNNNRPGVTREGSPKKMERGGQGKGGGGGGKPKK